MKLSYPGNLYLKIFKISPEETKFYRRGFRVTKSVEHLETIGEKFLYGYHAALSARNISDLAVRLDLVHSFYRGFAFEGAAMGLALLDSLMPLRKKLLPEFLQSAGKTHIYMAHVGIGWAFARLPWFRYRIFPGISNFDTLFRWLILDGFGFHEGYFYPQRYFHPKAFLNRLPGYAQNAFAQGLGRSLWFVEGADVDTISETISKFPKSIHADLWSGIGLACAYAGGIGEAEIEKLKIYADVYLPNLAQGAAFAAKARQCAENPSQQTETACRIICGCASDEAALITDKELENLPPDAEIPAYEVWRQRIQKKLVSREVEI